LATHRRRASKSGKTSSKPLLLWPFLVFQNFKESATEYSFNFIFIFSHFGEISPKKKKRCSQHLVHKWCAKAILLPQIDIIFIVTKKFRNIPNFFIAIFQKLKF
jgi:hypothetical protein